MTTPESQSGPVGQRKWRMTRLGPGDYLCLSNDKTTVWRFHTHYDGRAHGLTDVNYQNRQFWRAIHMPTETFKALEEIDGIPDPWSPRWTEADWYLPTRQTAINKMLQT